MFCENCGKELSEGAKFCSACGRPVNGDLSEGSDSRKEVKKEGKESTESSKAVYVEVDKIAETIKQEKKADRNVYITVAIIAVIIFFISVLLGI